MVGMTDMFADMLKKIVPPEVMAMITPEKMAEYGEQAGAFMKDVRDRFDRIEADQKEILKRLDDLQIEPEVKEDEPRKPSRRGRGSGSGSGDGGGDDGK